RAGARREDAGGAGHAAPVAAGVAPPPGPATPGGGRRRRCHRRRVLSGRLSAPAPPPGRSRSRRPAARGPLLPPPGGPSPLLPAPDGSTLLERVQERMHRLHTFRTDEVLEPAKLPLQTRYSFQAPDRLQIQASNGYAAVWVGPTRYDRSAPDAPWKAENVGISIPVPSMVWDSRDGDAYIGQHIIGTDTVDGVDAQVLNFLLQAGKTPLWFKLWVDADGLVH